MNVLITKQARAYAVRIFIGGDPDEAAVWCRTFCDKVGLCVTVTPTEYVFSGGSEKGVIVELINYARFPKDKRDIWGTALSLAFTLKDKLQQGSFTVQDDTRSEFWSSRDEDQPRR